MLRYKITKIVDKLPFSPMDIDRLLQASIKPTEDDLKMLHQITEDPNVWTSVMNAAGLCYGKNSEITTLEDAIECCGIQPLVQLIGVAYARKAIQEEFDSLKYLNEYLDHSEGIGIGCSILSDFCNVARNQKHIYVVAGLVHDVGRLAMIVATNRTSAHVLGTLWDKMASVAVDEKATLNTNHCEVGSRICQKWNFPPIIQEAVLRHHSPLIGTDFNLAGAIIFMSHFLSVSDPSGDIISTFSNTAEILSYMKLTLDDFDKARQVYKSRT